MNRRLLAVLTLALVCTVGWSQGPLSRQIPALDIRSQRIGHVLEIISNKGNFYFSYNSAIVREDSLVSFSSASTTVAQLLEDMLGKRYEFMESGNYIIIRKAPLRISLATAAAVSNEKTYLVSGFVLDEASGDRISNASIYEKNLLQSALTNDDGYFRIKLKSKAKSAALTVSKEFYEDTTVVIQPRYNQQVSISISPITYSGQVVTISPGDYLLPDTITVDVEGSASITRYRYIKLDAVKVERTAMGKLLLSSRQKIQSINLRQYFTERAFQLSLTPGLSTHGDLSAQVINKFSFNVFGGYTGGVTGVELGGLFNINKKYMRGAQLGGLFNITGGYVKGVQVAGIHNTVLDSLHGVHLAGVSNTVKGKLTGVQAAGVYNHASDSVHGLQLAGVANFSRKETDGAQIAGVINYTRRLKGVQIGLINISDSSEGYSLGLINIVLKGYHKLALYTNELMTYNAAFKTGNAKLYSILLAGMELNNKRQAWSFGYGIGKERPLGKRLSLNPELTAQHLYLGDWDHLNLASRAQLHFHVRIGKYLSVYAGPAYTAYYSNQTVANANYKFDLPSGGFKVNDLGKNTKGWFGLNAGIHIF